MVRNQIGEPQDRRLHYRLRKVSQNLSRSKKGLLTFFGTIGSKCRVSYRFLLGEVGPECTVKWELKLVVTNTKSKHDFDIYIGDHLQATLFLNNRWLGGSFMVATKSLPPPLLLTNETNQTATLSFKMQTDHAYFGEELIEKISRGINQVHLNVMARFGLMPTTLKLEGFCVLRLSCPDMGLCEFDSTHSMEIV
ncbi:hypothetical protein FF1_035374 [Malus domestica]